MLNPIPQNGWLNRLPRLEKLCSAGQWRNGVLAARYIHIVLGPHVDEFSAGAVPDGAGGAFVMTYGVNTSGAINQGPYALCHLDQLGLSTASISFGQAVGGSGFAGGAVVPSGAGRCIALWAGEQGRTGLVAQRYDSAGGPLWGPDPITASTRVAYGVAGPGINAGSNLVAEPDGSDGAIAAWFGDELVIAEPSPIYIQRLSAGGHALWGTDGVLVGESYPGVCPDWGWIQLVPDSTGGAIVLWSELVVLGLHRSETNYIAVTVNPAGTVTNGPVSLATTRGNGWIGALRMRRAVSDGAGGLFLAIVEPGGDLHCLRCSPALGTLWNRSFGQPIGAGAFSIREDERGGCLLTFVSAGPWPMLEMKRIDAAGTVTWDINAPGSTPIQIQLPIGSSSWPPSYWAALAQAVPNGGGGAMAVFQDWPNGRTSPKLFSLCVDAQGTAVSPKQPVSARAGGQEYPVLASGGGANAIVAWSDDTDSAMYGLDIWAQRLGCCPLPPYGEPMPVPFPCEILDFPGLPYKQLSVQFPCGDRDSQVGVLPLSRLSSLVRGLDCPSCLTNHDAPAPDWMRIGLVGLPRDIQVQLQRPNGKVVEESSTIDGPEGSASARFLTLKPSAKDEMLIVFTRRGKPAPGARFEVQVETAWGNGPPPPLPRADPPEGAKKERRTPTANPVKKTLAKKKRAD